MGRKTRRNKYEARAAEHRATQAKTPTPRVGATSKVINTGSIQGAPAKARVTRPKGIKLQPFSDVIPSVPMDYATVKADHLTQDRQVWIMVDVESGKPCMMARDECRVEHGDKCELSRVWTGSMPDRKMLDAERAKLDARPAHESAIMAVDRPSGAETFATYAARHADDTKAGLFRDGLGRIMRTEDMEEYSDKIVDLTGGSAEGWASPSLTCDIADDGRVIILEVNSITGETRRRGQHMVSPVDSTMSTMDYAHMHGVPIQRNTTQRAHAAAKIKSANADAREAKKAHREADRVQRKLDRTSGRGATVADRRERDERARAMLAELGVTNPTKFQMNAARDVLIAQAQVKAYTG
jgi:hypothetical protein